VINCKITYIFLSIFCGCSFYSTSGTIPVHIDSINITPIKNESTEFLIADLLSESLSNQILSENILKLTNQQSANSQLDITIKSVKEIPYTYVLDDIDKEYVDEWKLKINIEIKWYDLVNDELLVGKQISSFATYGSGVDINNDGLDNDNDGLIDSNDSDEYGPPRESAIRISVLKATELLINEITSTW